MFPAKIVLTIISLIPLITASPAKSAEKFNWSSKKSLIAFGDSYTYVQGTHGLQNYSFIGDRFNYAYDTQTLLSDMIVQNQVRSLLSYRPPYSPAKIHSSQTGTAEGGPNWVEYLTKCGLKPGLTSPRTCAKQLWDFAFAGADISTVYTPAHHNFIVPLVNQVAQFQKYGHSVLSATLRAEESLIAIWIGINDVGDSAKYSVDFPTFYANLTRTLFDSVDQLYELGYRSYLFMNLPPLDRRPGNVGSSSPSPNATQVAWYNAALAGRAEEFGREKKGVEVRVFDAHARLIEILDHPGQYGIVNTTSFCAGYDQPDIAVKYQEYGCPTPLDTYFWFNSGHMTSRVHRILAAELDEWLES
ncbi:uncharacterized protein N7459_009129 [Penicillium hispanicum]|uniref:uncharacterized protein n=1 Tax=Penicillium hispanicum TaxID=1080232 RepID=UPI00254218B3|nr:uncharacterized protein N7459_009129 [Penicillium hispanicum]KAJ5569699.1 hypothetical protein N7459_009129 [Penicillium hispanicum]